MCFLLLALNFNCSSFSSFLKCEFNLLILDHSYFLMCACNAIIFLLNSALLHLDKLHFYFNLIKSILKFPLRLFWPMYDLEVSCLIFKYWRFFSNFSITDFQLIFISTLLNLFMCLMSRISSFSVNIPCKFKKYVSSAVLNGAYYKYWLDKVNWQFCSGQLYAYFVPVWSSGH